MNMPYDMNSLVQDEKEAQHEINVIELVKVQQAINMIYAGPNSFAIPMNKNLWRRTGQQHDKLSTWDDGKWEIIHDGGLRIYGRGTREGNSITSLASFNGQSSQVYIQWRVSGSGQYTCFRVGVMFGAGFIASTGNSFHACGNNTLIQENTWYFTRIKINLDKSYEITTSTGNYDTSGGAVFKKLTGKVTHYWRNLQRAMIVGGLNDLRDRSGAWIEIKEAKITQHSPTVTN